MNARYQLRWGDIAERQRFEDCIALGAWGAEWHDRKNYVSTFDYPPDKSTYEIPLGCLQSIDTQNLLVAGRLADGDRLAGAAIRVMGTAFALSTQPALRLRNIAGQPVDARAVRARLRDDGAVLELGEAPYA